MGILLKSIQSLRDSPKNGQDVMSIWEINIPGKITCDCTSEPFTKPSMSSTLINRMTMLTLGSKKQSITLDIVKHIIRDLARQLDRVTIKVFGQYEACDVVEDLSLEECEVFIVRWSEELKSLHSKYINHLDKEIKENKKETRSISSVERFKRSLEGLNIIENQFQKLTEVQKDFLWFIHILKSLPKSSVCQEGCARKELLNLYREWKKGELISMLPIMDFIMKTLLKEKDSILKRKLQHRYCNAVQVLVCDAEHSETRRLRTQRLYSQN